MRQGLQRTAISGEERRTRAVGWRLAAHECAHTTRVESEVALSKQIAAVRRGRWGRHIPVPCKMVAGGVRQPSESHDDALGMRVVV